MRAVSYAGKIVSAAIMLSSMALSADADSLIVQEPVGLQSAALDSSFPGLLLSEGLTTAVFQYIDASRQWSMQPSATLSIGIGSGFNLVDIFGQGVLSATGQSLRYLTDSDDDGVTGNHIWYQDGLLDADRMMQLQHTNGGDLLIAGTLTSMHMFDLAESFWERERVEPGELVAIDPDRPDAVRLASEAYQPTLLGVASTRPAIVLGRGAFSVDGLRRVWGDEIAGEFERTRSRLESEALAARPELQAQARRVESFAGYAAQLEQERLQPAPGSERRGLGAGEIRVAAYEQDRSTHAMNLFDAAVNRFFADRFTSVALAGRVPVKADASFGAIRPGDLLTSSPVPGIAMKATRSGAVVGTALEGLASGTGAIQMLVHRGWFGGAGRSLAGAAPAKDLGDSKVDELERLRKQLADLEERLEHLEPVRRAALTASGTAE